MEYRNAGSKPTRTRFLRRGWFLSGPCRPFVGPSVRVSHPRVQLLVHHLPLITVQERRRRSKDALLRLCRMVPGLQVRSLPVQQCAMHPLSMQRCFPLRRARLKHLLPRIHRRPLRSSFQGNRHGRGRARASLRILQGSRGTWISVRTVSVLAARIGLGKSKVREQVRTLVLLLPIRRDAVSVE